MKRVLIKPLYNLKYENSIFYVIYLIYFVKHRYVIKSIKLNFLYYNTIFVEFTDHWINLNLEEIKSDLDNSLTYLKSGSSWQEDNIIIYLLIEIEIDINDKNLFLLKNYSLDNLGILNINNITSRNVNIERLLTRLEIKSYDIDENYVFFNYDNIDVNLKK